MFTKGRKLIAEEYATMLLLKNLSLKFYYYRLSLWFSYYEIYNTSFGVTVRTVKAKSKAAFRVWNLILLQFMQWTLFVGNVAWRRVSPLRFPCFFYNMVSLKHCRQVNTPPKVAANWFSYHRAAVHDPNLPTPLLLRCHYRPLVVVCWMVPCQNHLPLPDD